MYKYFASFTYQKTGSGGTGYANGFFEMSVPLDSQEQISRLSDHIASSLQAKTGSHVSGEKVVILSFQRV